ncbi:BFD-like [2Fe-2S] binding domain protein [Novipirellula aureliae]|uniref:BFD-like [2Fe-2S] binding domain protein n=1 Tax=Novipirellula aureliae TaxID=2527966 RepID=A0A5C6EA61_9BACT|nr:BFD-like [2Fe-2S] binding domain protein [Novipirellula aureliae]
MEIDEELCICFHVSKRKVIQFIRVTKPTKVSQLSECYGAGTGCGWCRPFLQKLMEDQNPESTCLPRQEDYAARRKEHRDRLG